jgi:hypothetical protein
MSLTAIEVYSPDFTTIHKVPSSAVVQMPSSKLNVKRLVECINFAATRDAAGGVPPNNEAWVASACGAGGICRFVHIAQRVSSFPGHPIHVHYIWQSLEAVTYARQWGGPCEDAPTLWLMNPPDCRAEVKRYDEQRERSSARLLTTGGNVEQHDKDENERVAFAMMVDLIASVAPALRVPATRLLKTVGATTYLQRRQSGLKPDYPLTPCGNYMCHNECRLGEECPGAHVINLDPSQSRTFVRRTLRHVKAASEATMVQNEGRVQNGLFGMPNNRGGPRASFPNPNDKSLQQMSDALTSSATQNRTTTSSNSISPSMQGLSSNTNGATQTNTDTASSSSPMQFNVSSLGDGRSYQNSSGTGGSGGAKSTGGTGSSGNGGSGGSGNDSSGAGGSSGDGSGGSGSSGGDGSGGDSSGESEDKGCEVQL